MRFLFITYLAVILAGCQSTSQVVTNTKFRVLMPDNSMYNCPTIKTFPNPNNLTDVQVAKLIVTLYKNNQTCKYSIDAIKNYLENAKNTLDK